MPHKLFIMPESHHVDSHGGYLQPFELVRGERVSLGLWVKNISNDPFPGGTVTRIELTYGEQRLLTTNYETLIEIKALEPQELSEAEDRPDVVPTTDGMVWLQVRIESKDGEAIEFFQVEDEPTIGTDHWYGALYVVNRERLATIDLLKSLNAEKGELNGSNME